MERLLQRDGIVRALSIILALVLWFNISRTRSVQEEKSFSVRLQPPAAAPGMQVLVQPQQSVEVKVRGPKRDLAGIRAEDLQARLELQDYTESGQYPVPVKVCCFPASLTYSVSPGQVLVTLEKQVKKEFAPTLKESEQVRDNVKFQAVLKDKGNVEVSGLQRDVNRVVRVEARVDLVTGGETAERQASLVPVDAAGAEVPNVDLNPRSLTAEVRAIQLPPAREVPVQPKFSGRVPDGYTFSVSVDPSTVKVRGPREHHRDWGEVATAPIDLNGVTGPFTVQASLIKPPGANSMDREYVTVTVNVTEQRTDRVFQKVKLKLWHLAANLEAQRTVQEVSVRLYGPRLTLETFNPESLDLHLELENLGPGRYLLPVRFTRPSGLEVLAVEPGTVEVVILEKVKP